MRMGRSESVGYDNPVEISPEIEEDENQDIQADDKIIDIGRTLGRIFIAYWDNHDG